MEQVPLPETTVCSELRRGLGGLLARCAIVLVAGQVSWAGLVWDSEDHHNPFTVAPLPEQSEWLLGVLAPYGRQWFVNLSLGHSDEVLPHFGTPSIIHK